MAEWRDTPQNGLDFYNGESPRSRTRNARLLATVRNGNRAGWDCTTLFYAILYSDSIHGLSATVRSNVDDLREFRNEEFAHMPLGQLSDLQFRLAVRKVEIAFQFLGVSTVQIQNICKQKSFQTEEVEILKNKVQDLLSELQVANAKLQTSEEQRHILEEQLHSDVSSFCILPPKPSHEISNRDSEVANITEQLEELREVNGSSLSYLYISGNPGSGKSQMAGLVAKKFYESANKDLSAPLFVMTLNAESSKTLLGSYISLARQIKCPEYTIMCTLNSTEMQIDEKINNLKDLIAAKIPLFASWLLVVDNVISLSDIHDFLPQPGNEQWIKGQLLITTQNTSCIPSESCFVSHISVSEGMVPTDACCFLAKISGIKDEEMENKVAKALDYQPLALASAGMYVKNIREGKAYTNFGWKEYLEKLERGKRALTEKELKKTNPAYRESMTSATRLAVKRAIDNDSAVKSAFTFLSLCAPQPLHLDIVVNYVLNVDKHVDKEEIAIQIQGYSLLLFNNRENGVYLSVHQVVHDVIKSEIIECQEFHGYVQAVDVAVTSFNQFIDTHLSGDSKHLIPHLNAFSVAVENVLLTEDEYQVIRGGVFNDSNSLKNFKMLGKICYNHCELFAAKVYYDTALKLVENNASCTDIDLADIYNALGHVLWRMGEPQQAKEHYERALDIKLNKLGPKHIDVAYTYNYLGTVERELGDLQQARNHHERALNIKLKNIGPEHVDVANTYHHLGNVQYELNDLQQAKEHYERALDIQLKNLGPDHVYVAFSYGSLGNVQQNLGDLQLAKENLERALDIRLKKLGPEHVDVAGTYNNLGSVHYDLGDLQQAKKHYKRALDIRLRKLGPEHVAAATTYSNLGIVQRDLGDLQQAKQHFERALDIRLRKLGPEHVDVARTYSDLGHVQYNLGDLQQAKELYECALDIRLRKLGPEHVDVASTYHDLDLVHRRLGDLQQAKEHRQRYLDILLRNFGPEHVYVAGSYHGMGVLAFLLGEFKQAKEYFERALEIKLKQRAPDHIHVATTYNNLGTVHFNLGHLQQAKEHYERALDIRLKKLGPEHVDVADTCYNLGAVQRGLGDLRQAKEHYERALGIQLTKLGPEHVDVARTHIKLDNVQRELCNK